VQKLAAEDFAVDQARDIFSPSKQRCTLGQPCLGPAMLTVILPWWMWARQQRHRELAVSHEAKGRNK